MDERTRKIALRIAALAVVFPAVWPCIVTFVTVIWLDVDPRDQLFGAAVTTFGPGGLSALHAVSVAIAAGAIGVAVRCGAAVRWGACALYGVGLLACLYHLAGTYQTMIAVGTYLSAATLALAAAHLCQHEIARRWIAAVLAAVLIPTAVEAVWYVAVEHPMTVRVFEQYEAQSVESRGWEVGSAQHDLFKRRLESPDAIGRFSLSNVLGSAAAGLTVLATAVTAGMWQRRAPGWGRVLSILVVACGLVTVMLTRSQGAILSLLAGYGLLILAALAVKQRALARLARWSAIALIAAAVLVVLVRGMFGPPPPEVGMEGERSLLFRFQYWSAAQRMLVHDAPANLLVGIGPGDFQTGYVLTKDALSPEEVTSAHNVFIDLIAGLGLGGLAWSAMLVLWLWQAGCAVARPSGQAPPAPPPFRAHVYGMACLAMLLFVPSVIVEHETLIAETALLWLVKLVLFIIAAVVMSVAVWTDRRWIRIGLFAAAGTVLLHNQIDMSFFHPPSAPLMWLIVGAAAGGLAAAHDEHIDTMPRSAWAPVITLAGCALVLVIGYAMPVQRHQRHMQEAGEALRIDAITRALGELDAAADEVATDPLTLRWQVRLRMELAAGAARVGQRDKALSHVNEALAAIAQADRAGLRGPLPPRLTAQVQAAAADMLDDPARIERAVAAYELAIDRAPQSLPQHLALGDLLWDLGRRDDAADAYRRALEISALSYLDIDKQLDADERRRIESRLTQIEDGP